MWVIAVDALVGILGVGLLGLLAWRVVIRPGLALSRAVATVTTQAGEALTLLASTQVNTVSSAETVNTVYTADTREASARRLPNEGIDVG